MKIQAAVAWRARAPLSVEEVDLDDPRDDEILVRVEAAGVCRVDDRARRGRLPVVFPIILGHEGAGVVERTGATVTAVRPGDRVLFTPDYCGRCPQCRLGYTPYCDEAAERTFTGVRPDGSPRAHKDGKLVRAGFFGQSSFATRALVTERNIVPVPAHAPLRYLAGLTCGIQAGAGAILNAMTVAPGRSVAIFGTGATGLAAVMAAAASGADEIIGIDRVARRLSIATGVGATHVIDPAGRDLEDISAEIVKVTRGGADAVLDTTGIPEVIMAGVESLATRGTCSVLTSGGVPAALPPGALLTRGRKLQATTGGHLNPTVTIARLLDLHARGRFPFDRLVRNYPFADLGPALADCLSGTTIKPVLTFAGTGVS